MKYRDFIRILLDNGFDLHRHTGGHRHYKGFIDGKTRLVTASGNDNDDVMAKNFSSMIRQSALPRDLFPRK
ncbi:MAG: type II toxin-antitoxin system HicA family toxin [Ferrovibrio sp.]|uniref:type II toxin-antitoxin system HicA family toxin n=1 Tax=Ferrovibrio sp. TaxID=1917215 RepID=UPI0026377DFA|nr:type II toxin-antitoxin system HicA family toxin [Ferrovibrio sp.]MCW0235311.1 type II toxin-antitoxin system HicA family toxin [Ferrovibrio sp.]